ncbi:MAG: hypothetical protein JNL39_08120 [Opitutaceae bacterium]|nr:hypothetical protein [Opitutaceae bacterium]
MKKWMYLIFPAVMLGVFVIFYMSHAKELHAKEQRQIAEAKAKRDEADAKKKAAEEKARADAAKRQAERDAEDKQKADEKAAKQAADDKRVRDDTAKYVAQGDAAQKQLNAQEQELDRLRKERDKTSREAFDIAKQVELTRIARRTAELEIQRMNKMIVDRASNSSLVRPPVIVAPPPAK